jgi:hypothetical protein
MRMDRPAPATKVIFCSKNVGSILGMDLRPPQSTVVDMVHAMLKVGSALQERRGATKKDDKDKTEL